MSKRKKHVEVYFLKRRKQWRFRVVQNGIVGEASRSLYTRKSSAKRGAKRAHPELEVVVVL